jgi:hypothetical protein
MVFADKKKISTTEKDYSAVTRKNYAICNIKSKRPLNCRAPTLLLAEGSPANIAPSPSRLLPHKK